METISHREMRNNSAEILRRVEAGEEFQVTNNGHPAAYITPVRRATLDELDASGGARPPTLPAAEVLSIVPVPADVTTSEIIEDARGRW